MASVRSPFVAFLALAVAQGALYLGTAWSMNGEVTPPLDDAFIHFQYADRLAHGAFFSYQAGEGYTSGATSLLWPILLAPGTLLGHWPGVYVWALGLSVLALAGCAWHTARWVGRAADERTGLLAGWLIVTSGPLLWGTYSGMEVALFACAIAAVLDMGDRPTPLALGWSCVLALVRPEGAVLAGLFALVRVATQGRRGLLWVPPVALGAIQPALNLVFTGTIVSSSAMAKQNPRFPHPNETGFVEFVWARVTGEPWQGDFTANMGMWLVPLFAAGAWWLSRRDRARAAEALVAWAVPLVLNALLVPLLWHHYRYLMPSIAAFVPLLALGCRAADEALGRLTGARTFPRVAMTVAVAWAFGYLEWARGFAENAQDILVQHVTQARWVAAHAPAGARVAANDVGVIGYLGGRPLLDLEGIISRETLPWALAGEGSIYAYLRHQRPDVWVGYEDWFPSMAASGVIREMVHAKLHKRTLAGGSDLVIATLDPAVLDSADRPPAGGAVVDTLDVSDLDAERAHAFTYDDRQPWAGRANRVVTAHYADGASVTDDARVLTGPVSFRMKGGAALVARLGGGESGTTLEVIADGKPVGTMTLAAAPGQWVEARVELPPAQGEVAVDVIPVVLTTGDWIAARFWTLAG